MNENAFAFGIFFVVFETGQQSMAEEQICPTLLGLQQPREKSYPFPPVNATFCTFACCDAICRLFIFTRQQGKVPLLFFGFQLQMDRLRARPLRITRDLYDLRP